MGRKYVIASIVAVAVGGLFVGRLAMSQEDPPYETGPNVVPDWVRDYAVGHIEANYDGRVNAIYQLARTTRGQWAQDEFNNAGMQRPAPDTTDDAVYAVFLEGTFQTHGPVVADPEYKAEMEAAGVTGAHFKFARLLLDAQGGVMGVRLDGERIPSDPPFGEHLDDK